MELLLVAYGLVYIPGVDEVERVLVEFAQHNRPSQ